MVARQAHNLKVAGSIPAPRTTAHIFECAFLFPICANFICFVVLVFFCIFAIKKMKCVCCGSTNFSSWSTKRGVVKCRDCGRFFTKNSNPLRGVIRADGRYCLKCGEFKVNSDLYFRDGRPRSICKECSKGTDDHSLFRGKNITKQMFDGLMVAQGGACAICGKSFESLSKTFIDHDHISGMVRGLLCPSCNTMIGLSNDSPETLSKAIDYLSSFH